MKDRNILKQSNIFGAVTRLTLLAVLFCSSGMTAKHKSVLEQEFNKAKDAYNQQQIIYKNAINRYEQKMARDKSFAASLEQREEYDSLQEMYRRQQKDYYELRELDRRLKEELKNRQSPYQLVFLGIGFFCLVLATVSVITGITLFYFSQKPFGKELIKLGTLLGVISGFSLLIVKKYYIPVFACSAAALICVYFYKKIKI